MDAEALRRVKKFLPIIIPVLLVLGIGFPYIMFNLVSPPAKGSPLAVKDIQSSQPFEVAFVSNGEEPRVFLDMECQSCSFPVTGELTLSVGDRVLHRNRVSAGDSRDRAWGGHDRRFEQQLIFSGPAEPVGTRIVLKGSLVVGAARGWTGSQIKDAPPIQVKVLRVTVAP